MNSEKGSRPERLLEAMPDTLRRPVSNFYNMSLAPKRELIALIDDDAELLNVLLEHLDRPDLVIQI